MTRWRRLAWVIALGACGNGSGVLRSPTTTTTPAPPPALPPPTTWVFRFCNDTPLDIDIFYFDGDMEAGSMRRGECSSYMDSEQLDRSMGVNFMVGPNHEEYDAGIEDGAGVLPFGVWTFHVKLVDKAKHVVSVEPVADQPTVFTRVCNKTPYVVQQLHCYDTIRERDLAPGACTPYRPAFIPEGYDEGRFFLDPDGEFRNQVKYAIEAPPKTVLGPGRWTFFLGITDAAANVGVLPQTAAHVGTLRRAAKPD